MLCGRVPKAGRLNPHVLTHGLCTTHAFGVRHCMQEAAKQRALVESALRFPSPRGPGLLAAELLAMGTDGHGGPAAGSSGHQHQHQQHPSSTQSGAAPGAAGHGAMGQQPRVTNDTQPEAFPDQPRRASQRQVLEQQQASEGSDGSSAACGLPGSGWVRANSKHRCNFVRHLAANGSLESECSLFGETNAGPSCCRSKLSGTGVQKQELVDQAKQFMQLQTAVKLLEVSELANGWSRSGFHPLHVLLLSLTMVSIRFGRQNVTSLCMFPSAGSAGRASWDTEPNRRPGGVDCASRHAATKCLGCMVTYACTNTPALSGWLACGRSRPAPLSWRQFVRSLMPPRRSSVWSTPGYR